ncbi:MAG: phosphopantothenoylcysteine decarboxylase [Candidatus Altiarchaeota archaeon]
MRVLITAGPTREPLDDVRYISNRSSGKMGYALAEESVRRGYQTILVSGPASLQPPEGVQHVTVETSDEMIDAVIEWLGEGIDVLISSAAISDFKPDKTNGKISSGSGLNLVLKPARKLIKVVRDYDKELFLVAFKAEHGADNQRLVEKAGKMLVDDGVNLVVANDVSRNIFDSDDTEAVIVGPRGETVMSRMSKAEAASMIWDVVDDEFRVRSSS